jgi:hypothetical protein
MPPVPSKTVKLLTIFAIATSLNSPLAFAQLPKIEGSKCEIVGDRKLNERNLYLCTKVKNSTVWTEVDDGTSLFAPFAITGPTWNQLAEQREAELILAEQAKVIKEAEAKAAKALAEKPKISGLEIGNLLWGDDFLGSTNSGIDSSIWSARNCHRVPQSLGGGACFGAESVFYAPSAIALDGSADGAAVISTNRITGSLPSDAGNCLSDSCSFISGRFDTHGKVAFKYGFIEARIKMPSGSGNHPAFWMLGENINQVGWPLSGEMDVTEVRGNQPTIATSATHFSSTYSPNTCCGNHRYTVDELDVGVDLSADFHTYAIAWLPNSISYYVDGKLISTTTPQNVGGHWSFEENFFLIVNNAVSAAFSGSWQDLQSSKMTIDWVRSYKLNGVGEVTKR